MRIYIPLITLISLWIGIEGKDKSYSSEECGSYLCPSIPEYATQYLKDGCHGDFSESLNQQKMMIMMEVQKEYNTKLNNVLLFGCISSAASLAIGYLYGKFDQTFTE